MVYQVILNDTLNVLLSKVHESVFFFVFLKEHFYFFDLYLTNTITQKIRFFLERRENILLEHSICLSL